MKNKKINMYFLLSGLLFIFMITLSACFSSSPSGSLKVEKGVLDATSWDFSKNIELDGEWEFYWMEFLPPGNETHTVSEQKDFINVPGDWLKKKSDTYSTTAYGYATYRVTIKCQYKGMMGLKMPVIWTAYKLWVNDQLTGSCGIPGKTAKDTRGYEYSGAVYFEKTADTLVLTLHVANFDDLWGGILNSIKIGTWKNIQNEFLLVNFYDFSLFGAVILFALYHFIIYLFKKKEISYLFLGFFCLALSLRRLFAIAHFFSYGFWPVVKNVGWLIMVIGPSLFLLFIHLHYPKYTSKIAVKISIIISAFFSVIILVTPFRFYVHLLYIIQAIILIIAGYILVILFIAAIKEKQESILLIIPFLILSICVVNDILYTNGIIHTYMIIPFGLFMFALFQSFILSLRFTNAFIKIENLTSELREYSQELEDKVLERTAQLQEATKSKTTFFVNMVHEIKTPLTIISNYLDKDIKVRGSSRAIDIVKQNVDKLKRDVINILDLEKLHREQDFYNHNQAIDFSDFLRQKIFLFRDIAACKTITLHDEIQEGCIINVDPFAADRIINNILDNAIKYTPPGGNIYVILKKNLVDYNKSIEFITRDTGIGISEDHINHIFKPFYQVSQEKRNVQGIGIGLSIVNKIVEQCGGGITVQSNTCDGSRFIISFPCPDIHTGSVSKQITCSIPYNSSSPVSPEPEVYNPNTQTIFIVEDNLTMLSYLQQNFMESFNVFYAQNGKQALEKIKNIPRPGLIISDIMMDEMNGYEFYDSLTQDSEYKSIPFLFLTAKTGIKEKLNGLLRGAIDFLSKPFSIEELTAKVITIFNYQETLKESHYLEMEKKIHTILRKSPESEYEKEAAFNKQCDAYGITKREKDVIRLLIEGFEYKEISSKLNISINTLRPYIHRIYKKMNVQNKVELTNVIKKTFN